MKSKTSSAAAAVSIVLVPLALSAPPHSAAPPRSQPGAASGRVVDFAPGVRINWRRPQVELAARIVLREGPLELFACSPHTREHESVLAVEARPWHIYQALGLIGLRPGQPVTYDEQNDRWLPADGDRVTLHVRCPGESGEVDISEWMLDARTKQSLPPQDWVFCGSRRFGAATFGADANGTVVCLVDFDTALIGLPQSHSADNALLWAVVNTPRIPPEGTGCTLLIRAAEPQPLLVECLAPGHFRVNGQPLDPAGLEKLVREHLAQDPKARIAVRVSPGLPADAGQAALKTIRAAGAEDVRLERPARKPESQPHQPARPPAGNG